MLLGGVYNDPNMNTHDNLWKKVWSKNDLINISLIFLAGLIASLMAVYFINVELVYKVLLVELGLVVSILGAVLWRLRVNKISLSSIGIDEFRFRWIFLAILLSLLVITIGGFLSSSLANFLGKEAGNLNTEDLLSDSLWLNVLYLKIFGAILIPIVEELYFRGVLFRYFRQNNAFLKAALWSSTIFALLHISPVIMPFAFVLGFTSAWIYNKTNSLLPSFMLHIAVNSFAINLLFLSTI